MEEREEEREEAFVRSLVGKICGSLDGCSILNILSDIDRLCQASKRPDAPTTHAQASEEIDQITRSTPSGPERIWRLLADSPQISIGFNRQFNSLSLADLWHDHSAAIARISFLRPTAPKYQNEVTVAQVTPPITDLTEEAIDELDVATSVEPISTVLEEQTPIASDKQTSDVHPPQHRTRSGGTTLGSSSRHTTEVDALEGPDRSATPTSRENKRGASFRLSKGSNDSPQISILPKRPSAIDPRLRPQGFTQDLAKPSRQGSRKYLQGTEGFWNEMFWHARNQCEGQVTGRFKGGIATHPGARALYAKRPAGIDAVILAAIKAGLPVPIDPQDITDAWRDRTAWVLNRSQRGVYITPEGVRRVDSSQYADHSEDLQSQIMVLRSNRLREVDFSERGQNLNIKNSPASAAHNMLSPGFFSQHYTATTGPFGPPPPVSSTEKNLSFLISAPKSDPTHGPHLGASELSNKNGSGNGIPSLSSEELSSTSTEQRRKQTALAEARTTHPSDPSSRATTTRLESPDLGRKRYPSPVAQSWRGLPPPLTTRSRKRKLSDQLHATTQSPRRQKQSDTVVGVSESRNAPMISAEAVVQLPSSMIDGEATSTSILRGLTPKETLPPQSKARRSKVSQDNRKEFVKQILLEVIEECGGIIPNEYASISEYLTKKFRAKHKTGQVDKKMWRDLINSLCTNGRLKRLAFTYQRSSGTMATSKILANINVDATSEAVTRLQQNIINAQPDLYVPPLGSVLDAPLIEATLPNTPPATPPAKKRSFISNISARAANVRHLEAKHHIRNDLFGASPARRPFAWQGSPHLISVQGSEDDASLAFLYVASNWSPTGYARWTNVEAGPLDDGLSAAKANTTIPKGRVNTRTRNPREASTTGLAGAETQKGKLNWRTEKPVTSLTFNTEARTKPVNEDNSDVGVAKFGRSSRGRKIIWKTRDSDVLPPSLPSSLQDILDMPGQIPTIDYSMTEDPESDFFFWELDAVEYWECNILKIYQQRASEWTFVNHGSKERRILGLPKYSRLQWEAPDVLTSALFTPHPISIRHGKATHMQQPQNNLVEQDDELFDSDYDPAVEVATIATPAPLRRSRRKSSLQPIRSSTEPATRTKTSNRKSRPLREDGRPVERQGRPRILQGMSTGEIYRIVLAVIVVRTLAGGITGEIDWSIVQKLCPTRDETFLADRWSTLIIKNRQDIANLTESMQKKYVIAYEKDEVPCINFADVQHSDWEAILSWAEENLDKTASDEVDALPSTRAELLQNTKLTFIEPKTLRDALGHTGYQPQSMKEEILAKTPAAVQLQGPSDPATSVRIEAEVEEGDSNLSLAKSWAMSTVMTADESLDPATVTRKLLSITPNKKEADQLFDRALKILQRNQIIKRSKNGKTGPGPWRASERWFEMFETKRMVTGAMLKRAAAWKRDVLDPAVRAGQSVLIDKMQIMQDGEMVAIVNMIANRRCKITAGPAGLPKARYGLDPNATSYNTKGMGRLLTLFATTVKPTAEYVTGDPMAGQRLAIPLWEDGGHGKIPCWIDMNGRVLMKNWEMVVGAIVGLLSGRPGISAVELERTLGHGVTGWEVGVVLAWLEGGGFAGRTERGVGWETREWWWLVCGFEGSDGGMDDGS